MKLSFLLLIFVISISSCESSNEYQPDTKPKIYSETFNDSLIVVDDTIKNTDITSLCLPMPNDSFFLVKNNFEFLKDYEYEPIYYYVNSEFDSLEPKQITKSNLEYTSIKWTQKFENKITIQSTVYPEYGSSYKLYSHCKNKSDFFNTINKIIEFQDLDSTYYNPEMSWNKDSTRYEPIEQEAGCYYEITKDSIKNYILEWQCGC